MSHQTEELRARLIHLLQTPVQIIKLVGPILAVPVCLVQPALAVAQPALDQGRIVERGAHFDLLEHDGRYAELYEQFILEPSIQSEM